MNSINLIFSNCANYIIVSSDKLKKLYPNKKTIVLINSPEYTELRKRDKNIGEGYFTIFYAGLLSEDRGIKHILEAIKDMNDVKLVIGGWGPMKNEIIKASKENANIKYVGFLSQNEIYEFLLRSDATFAFYDPRILNNRFACPNKLFEAMMFGVPIIVNKKTVAAEIVSKESCGIVIEYGNTYLIKEAISKLKNESKLRVEIGKNASKAFKEKYTFEVASEAFINCYEKLKQYKLPRIIS
jgi:glycosyltransferase involved in cell wall biosynthesis